MRDDIRAEFEVGKYRERVAAELIELVCLIVQLSYLFSRLIKISGTFVTCHL